jgi:hypothetical protein
MVAVVVFASMNLSDPLKSVLSWIEKFEGLSLDTVFVKKIKWVWLFYVNSVRKQRGFLKPNRSKLYRPDAVNKKTPIPSRPV